MSCFRYTSGSNSNALRKPALCLRKFNGIKKGTIFNIDRPAFLADTETVSPSAPVLRGNNRKGIGNREIVRDNFMASKIMGRKLINFDKLAAIDLENEGVKIQLGERTISELFTIRLPDPQDKKWLTEKARMTARFTAKGLTSEQILREFQVNKPLGREQRTISSKSNIASHTVLTLGEKLSEIEREIRDGRAESRGQQAVMVGHIANIISATKSLEGMNKAQLVRLSKTIRRLDIPLLHREVGIVPRIADINYYRANEGIVNLYFLNQADRNKALDLNRPVLNFTASNKGLPGVKLTSMISAMGKTGKKRVFIDFGRSGVINRAQMMTIVSGIKGGFDSDFVSVKKSIVEEEKTASSSAVP